MDTIRIGSIIIPSEITFISETMLGIRINWINPFENMALFEVFNKVGKLIFKMFIDRDSISLSYIEKYLNESYSIQVTEITSRKIKIYSVAYD